MDYKFVQTTCPYCGCGCQMLLEVLDGKLIGTHPLKTGQTNQGKLCIKGWTVHEFVHSGERLTRPLIKTDGSFREASWEEALDLVVARLTDIREKHGPDALGFLSSARATNEENYLMQKLCRVGFGTNNVDHCARLWHAPTVAGLAAAFGNGAMTNSIAEIEDASCLFVIGSNTTEAHPLIAHRLFAAKGKGAKLIVVDPRVTQIARLADLHIRPNFGTDVALINGMMHEIVAKGYHDTPFITERTEGFAGLREVLQDYAPEQAEKICGVPAAEIREAAKLYATSEPSSILYTLGITEHSHGVDNVKTLANLAMLTGQIGKRASGVNPLRGQNNVQGACDMGALPNVYPGYQVVTDLAARLKFEQAWQAKLPDKAGLTIPQMIDGLIEGSVKGMFIVGEDTALSDPDTHHITHALTSAEFLVVQDIFLSETAKLADVVLPAACWAEKEGTFSCTERKVQRVRKAVEPPGEAKPDWVILSEIARRLGLSCNYAEPREIFAEMAALSPIYGGISYERLERQDLHWPCPTDDHPGTPFLHQERFGRGRGLFAGIGFRPSEELPDEEFPFFLTTGRHYAHYNARTMTGRCPTLTKEYSRAITQMHVNDAEKLGLRDGDPIKVISRRGEVRTWVRPGTIVPEGAIFMDFHFADANSNVLLGTSLDPVTKTPDYKVCAVRIEAAGRAAG